MTVFSTDMGVKARALIRSREEKGERKDVNNKNLENTNIEDKGIRGFRWRI